MTRATLFAIALTGCGGTVHPAPMQPWEQTAEVLAAQRGETPSASATSEETGASARRATQDDASADEPTSRNARTARARTADADADADLAEADAPGDAPPGGRILRGRASYYHDSLAGNPTASGERYDPRKRTAASRTLPFGTRLRITRIDTGATTIVRVNDRGPFGDRRRILDLSRRAAEDLDMIRAGVIRIRAEIID